MEFKWFMIGMSTLLSIIIIGESSKFYNEETTAQKAMEKGYIQIPGPRSPYRTLWVKEVNEND